MCYAFSDTAVIVTSVQNQSGNYSLAIKDRSSLIPENYLTLQH